MSNVLSSPLRTNTIDEYDHAINLVDATAPDSPQPVSLTVLSKDPGPSSKRNSDGSLSRKWNKETLRRELAQRKYARWQEKGEEDGVQEGPSKAQRLDRKEDLSRRGRLREKLRLRSKRSAEARTQAESAIDILYENQRGSFFFGIPLYSSKSLLNFDPSGWQTSAFKDSPVNITNAQLPDPSWAWDWNAWYVDMSHDVDEQGWEYSFSFQRGFSWHGSHPWFHSFVRRRRWLRKRSKTNPQNDKRKPGSMGAGHMLNPDYFTIHVNRGGSRSPSGDRASNNRSSHVSSFLVEGDSSDEEEDINNIPTLLHALKKTTIDRKKLEAIQSFLDHGDEDLHYLSEYMHEIMGMFMYQSARREFLLRLKSLCDDPLQAQGENLESNAKGKETETQRHRILHEAMRAAEDHIKDLEYWSDRKNMVQSEESQHLESQKKGSVITFDGAGDDVSEPGSPNEIANDGGSDAHYSIKGIPSDAGLDEEPGINRELRGGLDDTDMAQREHAKEKKEKDLKSEEDQ